MLEALASSLREHGLEDEAQKVLARPAPTVHVEPELQPEVPVRIQRKSKRTSPPPSSSLTRQQRVNEAWNVLKLKHGN
jgi:hypothetical protein